MDSSPENIKMCEKAEEIQKQAPEVEGEILKSVFAWMNFTTTNRGNYYASARWNGKNISLITWLPRQDQLQEMLGLPLWQLNFKFIDWLCDLPYDGHIRHEHLQFTSMEQLWLGYVMHELYQKKWEGENWVAEG